jgi:GT2 family glycosyltransferase
VRPDHSRALTLAVVVPATDAPPTLDACLAALRDSSEPADELIVVTEPAGTGPAAARNAGASEAGSDLVVFVDADIAVAPDALGRLRQAFVANPRLAATFGSYDDRPSAPGAVSRFRNLLHHHVHSSSPGPAETFWGGLGAIRRRDFVAVGGFDSQRFAHPAIEDIELGMRLRDRDAAIVLDPGIQGTHLKRWTLRSMLETDVLRRGIPWTRLQLERGSVAGTLNLGWRHRLSALASVAGVVALARGRLRAALACLAGLVALNRRFYVLLYARGGARLAVAGVPLHVLHHLAAATAAIAGLVLHLGGQRR